MEKEQLELLLISAGLSKKEAQIYLYLLEKGPSKALEILRKLRMKKGNTYALLKKLIKKGFVVKRGTKFVPHPPQMILYQLEEKAETINNNLNNFKNLLPKLNSMYKLSLGKPTIQYFEGEQGIKEVFKDIYAPKKDAVYGCVDLEKTDEVFPQYIISKLIPKRIRNRVKAISLVADSPQAREVAKKDKEQLRKTTLIDKKRYPLPAEIDVYEDKIAMLTFAKGEFIGLLIENKDLAQTLRSIFKLAFLKSGKSAADQNTRRKTS